MLQASHPLFFYWEVEPSKKASKLHKVLLRLEKTYV